MPISPIYTPENTSAAYQLNWALSLFLNGPLPHEAMWLSAVSEGAERDGVRILEWRSPQMDVVQFWLSTTPLVKPSAVIKSIKGRLQAAIRSEQPQAFRRNYRLESIGAANVEQTLDYIALQPQRHEAKDAVAQQETVDRQLCDPEVDLTRIRYSAHGEFIHNLHLSVELPPDARDLDTDSFDVVRQMLRTVCAKHVWLLARAGLVADHIHLGVGCGIDDVPQDVALSVLNNLAFAFGMRPRFRFSYYVGTFGPRNRGAIRHAGSAQPFPTDPVSVGTSHFPTDPVSVVPCLMATAPQPASESREKLVAAEPERRSVATRHLTTDTVSVGEGKEQTTDTGSVGEVLADD